MITYLMENSPLFVKLRDNTLSILRKTNAGGLDFILGRPPSVNQAIPDK